jgi:hypothetical protein
MSDDIAQTLIKYLDGSLSAKESAEVESLLASSVDAQALLREIAIHAVAVRDDARIQSKYEELASDSKKPKTPAFPMRSLYVGTPVAVVVLAIVGFILWPFQGTAHTLRVLQLNGSMTWENEKGEVITEFPNQTLLGAGELALDGQGANAVLAFEDGTRIVLGHDTRVGISNKPQKKIVLRNGKLDADVVPQVGKPFVVETAAATLSVVGTVFSVRADHQHTSMNVESGLVRLERSSDKKVVNVAAKQGSLVSMDPSVPLRAVPTLVPPTSWNADITGRTLANSLGKQGKDPVSGSDILQAVPLLAARKPDRSPIYHFGIHFQEITSEGNHCFVKLTNTSILRLTYRTKKPSDLLFFTHAQMNSTFPGENFELLLLKKELSYRESEWITLEIPLSRFRAFPPMYGNPLTELWMSTLSIKTFDPDDGLEVSSVEIAPAASTGVF